MGRSLPKACRASPVLPTPGFQTYNLQTVGDHTEIVSNLPVLQGDLVIAAPGHSCGKQKKMFQLLALEDDEGVTGPEEEGKQDRRRCKAGQSRAVPTLLKPSIRRWPEPGKAGQRETSGAKSSGAATSPPGG